MFIGVLRLTLHLPAPGSLKSKRHLLRSAIDRVKARFNVSIAEVAENDLWQRSVLGVTAVGNDHAFVNESLDKVADFVAGVHGGQVQVLDRVIAIETFPDGMGDDGGSGRTLADAEADLLRAQAELDEALPERAGGTGGPDRSRGPTISNDSEEEP